jgi:thioredoxin reductase
MKKIGFDSIVIGGGASGMSAAHRISERGHSVAIIDREEYLGGILLQCIHSGFGVHEFKEELTGPEYAERHTARLAKSNAAVYTSTTVVDITDDENGMHVLTFSSKYGVLSFDTKSVVLAMGCRERNRGNIGIPGTRPSGIFTAGLAQRLINIDGFIPGKRAVIIGSGDIGLIMARRLTWSGSVVSGVIEILPYPSGLSRNISQCLNDFGIPLYLGHTVSRISGKDRVCGVEVTPLDQGKPIAGKSFTIDCDTILLSVGLIPENELSKKAGVLINHDTGGASVDSRFMTSKKGIFACGNVLHVHDLVDNASLEAKICGGFVSEYLEDDEFDCEQNRVIAGANVIYVIPNQYSPERDNLLFLRSFIVKNDARLIISAGGNVVKVKKLLHVQPSEMIDVMLKKEELATLAGSAAQMEISIQ